jgi:hypothetical protein
MALMLILWIIGFCMMASCRGVATYAAELKKTRVIVVPESFLIRYPKRFKWVPLYFAIPLMIARSTASAARGRTCRSHLQPSVLGCFVGSPIGQALPWRVPMSSSTCSSPACVCWVTR